MKVDYDVIVVGAGPAGSVTAWHAAKNGARVLLLEKKQEIGAPLRCAEGVSKKGLDNCGIKVDRKWVSAEMAGAKIVSPGGNVFRLNEKSAGNEVGFVLERHLFDKAMAIEAAKAGAEIKLKASVTGLMTEGSKITGVHLVENGEHKHVTAHCIVGADGYESQVGRWGGIDTTLKPGDITTCYQYRLANIDIEPDYCEFIIGSMAPGGYVWIFPKGEGIANVGIGVLLNKLKHPGEVKMYMDKFIAKDPRLNKGQAVEAIAGAVSVCAPLDKVTRDNMLLVGDAARIIDPITGGGIINGCQSGMFAGQVLGKCAQAGDFSDAALQPYEKLWRDAMENRLWRNWMAKEKFLTLSDKTLDSIVETLNESDIDKVTVYSLLKAIKEKHPEVVKEFEDLI
jgi:digeranylgeranylglycerophospholipid reductase